MGVCAANNARLPPNAQVQNEQKIDSVRVPPGFINSLKEYIQTIVDSSKTSVDQLTNLMNIFQFFKLNSRYLWYIAINPEYSKANIDLILESIEGLLNVLPTYIKSNMNYTLFICQILSAYAKIVFQFYATNGKRYLKLDTQSQYLNLITAIEQELQIERDNDQLLNNVEFELFQINAAFTLAPTDSKEGQEILTQFLGGAIKAAMTFTFNDELLDALKKGTIYLYNEYKKHQIKRKFEIIYYITGLKYETIQEIEKNQSINVIVEILTKFYLKIIKDCVDWEIKCCWIKSISEIINHKIQLKPQDFQQKPFENCFQKQFILKIQQEYYVNVNNSQITNDVDANMIFQQVDQLKLLSNMQKMLIQGNQEVQGFEDFYKIKLKVQSTDTDQFINKSALNNIKRHIKNQTILQKKIKEEVKNKVNSNYFEALIKEQLEEILFLGQNLHELTQQKALLTEQDDSKDSVDYQISMIHYLIDTLRTNNQQLIDENLKNSLSNVGISKEYQQSQKENINIILKLEQQLKSLVRMKTQTTKSKIFHFFQVIDQYEILIIHNIEYLFKLKIQIDQAEGIEYCEYRGLETIINQLYQIMQQIQLDKTFTIETSQQPSKIQRQLKKELIYLRHANIKLEKLSQFKSKDTAAQEMLKIQQQNSEIINKLIVGIETIQKLIEGSQNIKDNEDSSILQKLLQLLDYGTLNYYNEKKVEQIKFMAINFKQYVQSIKDKKKSSQSKEIEIQIQDINQEELDAIVIQLEIISKFIIIPSQNEKLILVLLQDLKNQIQTLSDKKFNELNQPGSSDFKNEIDFFKEILNNVIQLRDTQQKNLINITNNYKVRNLINDQNQNIEHLKTLGNKYKQLIEGIQNQIKDYDDQENSIEDNLKLEIQQLQQLDILISSHHFKVFPKELESQIIFILKSIQNQNVPTQHKLFDQFAVQMEDALNNSQWRTRQCIIFELQQMQSNLLEPQVVAVNQALLLKLQIYETDNRIKVLFQSPELIKQQTQLMEQYWPTIEEQVQKTIKEKLDSLNSLVYQIQSEKQEQAKQRLQKKYKELQEEINEELQNVSTVTSSLGITVLFLQDMKQDLNRIQDTLNQIQQAINEIGQNIKALRGKSFWDLLELRMKNVFIQMHIALAETIYIPIKTREKQIGVNSEDNQTNLFTDDLFGDGEVNEFIWKETKDSMMIHGLAGSGKSTSSRKIEEFIWRIYEKSQNETDIVPIVPIFVQLPTLKEPSVYAVEETLKSDNYRFNNKQIDEMKEGVNQGKLRLILIFDSYDELQQQFIGINLYHSNKLEKWRKQGDTCYPKVITTSRSELFTSENYDSWFISDKIEKYKEIRLVKFNDSQIQAYIDEFVFLQKKLTVKEFSEIKNSIEFEKQWRRDISSDQDLQLRLENFVLKENLSQTKQQLDTLWSAQDFRDKIEEADLIILLETPFMLEIVMQVLPKVAEQFIKGQINQQKQSEIFTTYNFYQVFLDQYFDRQIYKLQSKENTISIKNELWDFAQKLAIEMTMQNLSQVDFKSNGLVFKKQISDWKDVFFNDDTETGKYKRLFRQCIPLRQKLGNYSFNHKSIQEFLVAKQFIENIDKIEEQKYFSEVNWSICSVEWFEGIIRFIKSKIERQNYNERKLKLVMIENRENQSQIIPVSNSIYILNKLALSLTKSQLSKIKFKDVNLKGINLESNVFDSCHFQNVNLQESILEQSNFDDSIFENVNLSKANLNYASLKNCKWLNVKLEEANNVKFQIDNIEKIDIIEKDEVLLFNKLKGQIIYANLLQQIQKVKKIEGKILDYAQFAPKNIIYICEDCIMHSENFDKKSWVLKNSSTKIIQYSNFTTDKKGKNLLYIVNGISLLEIKIQFVLTWIAYGESKYELKNDQDFKTRILIEENTELIAAGQDFILATHPGSLISLYNLNSDQIIFKKKYINQGNIVSIAINDDGQYLISGSDYSLKLYQNDQEQNIFFGHMGVVTQLQFLENKYFLSSSQEDHQIRFWSIEKQQSLWKFVTSIKISTFAVNQKEKLLLIGSHQGIIQKKNFDFEDFIKCEDTYHKTGILCCDVDNFNKIFATGSKDDVIKVWNLKTGKQKGKDMRCRTPICLQLYGNRLLYSGEQQGFIVEWNLSKQQINWMYDNYGDSVTHLLVEFGLCFRSNDSVLKCFEYNGQVSLKVFKGKNSEKNNTFWINENLENYQKAKDLQTFQEILDNSQITQITKIIHSIQSQYCAYGMVNGNLIVQHKYGKRLEQQAFGSKIIELIELQEDQFICISKEGFKIFKLNEESIVSLNSYNFKNGCNCAILKKNSQQKNEVPETLIVVDNYEITLINIQTGMNDNKIRSIKLNQNTQINTIAVQNKYNEILYCGTQEGTIQTWDMKTEQMTDVKSISKLPITNLIFLESSYRLIASSEDGNVYFLYGNSLQEEQIQSKIPIRNMQVSEDEKFILLTHSSHLTLWVRLYKKTEMVDSFGEFKNISAISANFPHLYVLIGDVKTLYKIPLQLRRISKFHAEELNHYPTCAFQQKVKQCQVMFTGDNFGKIGIWNQSLELNDFIQFNKLRINEIIHCKQYNDKMLLISYDRKIILANYEMKSVLYEFPIQSEFVSCCDSSDIYYGIDQSLNCLKFDENYPAKSQHKQITKRFSKFDKIISQDEYLFVYSEKYNAIQKFGKKCKQFSVWEDNQISEFLFNQSILQDSVIRDEFGNDMNQVFLSCGAIDLSEYKDVKLPQDQ